MRQRAEYWLVRGLLATLALGPVKFSYSLAKVYARLFDIILPRLRRSAYRNLSVALPELNPRQITNSVFESIARILVSFARFPSLDRTNIRQWIDYEGFEHFEAALQRGRGVLFATAHLGNWELSAFAHALLSEPMGVVVRPIDNPLVDALVERRRALSGNTTIRKKEAARAVLRMLAGNKAVGILIDQNVQPQEGIFVDFFGVPASAGVAFARLAHRTGAAVIPGYAIWLENEKRYKLKFYAEISMTGDEIVDTGAVHSHLEGVIRQYPDQWIWLHRRWKTRPPGEPSFY